MSKVFNLGPFEGQLKTDDLGRLLVSTDPNKVPQVYTQGNTGNIIGVTDSGELLFSPESEIVGASGTFVGLKDGHGGKLSLNIARQTVNFAGSGATVTVSGARLAKKRIEGVVGRVRTVLAGLDLTTMKIGDGSDDDRYGATIAAAAGTTFSFSTSTANPGEWIAAAGDIVFTANAGVFQSGEVDLEVFYWDLTPPTGV